MVMGHQRAGTKIIVDLHSRQTLELSTKDLPKASSKAELQTEVVGQDEVHTHQDPYTTCTMATKPIIVPKIALSTSTPNRK
jgi:hypothetical protein